MLQLLIGRSWFDSMSRCEPLYTLFYVEIMDLLCMGYDTLCFYYIYMGTMSYGCVMSNISIFLACLIGVEHLAVSWPGTFIMYIL